MNDETGEGDYTEEVVLAVLRRHGIGAFNGSQVACSHCRVWLTTDEYHQHVAQIVARWHRSSTGARS